MKQFLVVLFSLISTLSFSQEFEVTPNGIKDKLNPNNNFLVIEVENIFLLECHEKCLKIALSKLTKNPGICYKRKN